MRRNGLTLFKKVGLLFVGVLSVTVILYAEFQVPQFATVVFTNVDGEYRYNIQEGDGVQGGTESGAYTVGIFQLYVGETITVTAFTTGSGGCTAGEHFTMQLFVGGHMVGQSSSACGSKPAIITYIV